MTTGTVAAIVIPLTVALIGVVATVLMKRVDLRSTAEQAHAEKRIEGYEHLLAGFDSQWYWNVAHRGTDEPEDSEEKAKLFRQRDEWQDAGLACVQKGIDLLHAHSKDVSTIESAIVYISGISAFEVEGVIPDHYEQARQLLLDCQRRETGLAQQLRLGGIKRWPKKLAALRESVKPPPTRVEQFARETGSEHLILSGPPLAEWLRRRMELDEAMDNSLTRTTARLEHWRTKGIWTTPLPESTLDADT